MGGQSMGGAGGGVVLGPCTLMPDNCPAGYTCACGGAGVGQCECHKDCTRNEDCNAAGYTCGCEMQSVSPGICVNACFCLCG